MFFKRSANSFFILLAIFTDSFAVENIKPEVRRTNKENKNIFKTNNIHSNNLFKQISDSAHQHESQWDYHLIRNLNISADLFRSTSNKGNAHLRTLIPLWMDKQHKVLFFAPGLTYYQQRLTYNAGLGLRHLNNSENFLWGINIFYDHDIKGGNRRLSQGVELSWPHISFFGNWYQGLNKWHKSPDDICKQEKPANGFGIKMRMTLPVYPQLSFSAHHFSWKGRGVNLYKDNTYRNSPQGFTYSAEYRPVPLIGFSVSRSVATKKKSQANMTSTLHFVYDFSRSLRSQTQFSWKPAKASLSQQLFRQVEREYGIVLNTRSQKPDIFLPATITGHENEYFVLLPSIESKGHKIFGYQWSSSVLSLSSKNGPKLVSLVPPYVSGGNNRYPVTLTVLYENGQTISAHTTLIVQPAIQAFSFKEDELLESEVLENEHLTGNVLEHQTQIMDSNTFSLKNLNKTLSQASDKEISDKNSSVLPENQLPQQSNEMIRPEITVDENIEIIEAPTIDVITSLDETTHEPIANLATSAFSSVALPPAPPPPPVTKISSAAQIAEFKTPSVPVYKRTSNNPNVFLSKIQAGKTNLKPSTETTHKTTNLQKNDLQTLVENSFFQHINQLMQRAPSLDEISLNDQNLTASEKTRNNILAEQELQKAQDTEWSSHQKGMNNELGRRLKTNSAIPEDNETDRANKNHHAAPVQLRGSQQAKTRVTAASDTVPPAPPPPPIHQLEKNKATPLQRSKNNVTPPSVQPASDLNKQLEAAINDIRHKKNPKNTKQNSNKIKVSTGINILGFNVARNNFEHFNQAAKNATEEQQQNSDVENDDFVDGSIRNSPHTSK